MNKTLREAMIHIVAEFYRLEIKKVGHSNDRKLAEYFSAIEEMDETMRESHCTAIEGLEAYFHGDLYRMLLPAVRKYGLL